MIDIRLIKSRGKGILRVDVHRRHPLATDDGKAKYGYRQIGSFLLTKGYNAELAAILDHDELVELQNWLANIHFGLALGISPDELVNKENKYAIYFPPSVYHAMIALSREAERVGLTFVPYQVMLDALLTTAKQTERRIDKINGFSSDILKKIGIDSSIQATQGGLEAIDNESKTLFQALLNLPNIKQTCLELETAARQYGKSKHISPTELQGWAKQNTDRRVKKWSYAIAIDVLYQHGIDVLSIARPDKVAAYWAIQRSERLSLKEAIKLFNESFNIPDDLQQDTTEAIINIYKHQKNKIV